MSTMRVVIHKPEKEADMWRLLHEISQYRAEKTMKCLQEVKLTPQEITKLISELHIPF